MYIINIHIVTEVDDVMGGVVGPNPGCIVRAPTKMTVHS